MFEQEKTSFSSEQKAIYGAAEFLNKTIALYGDAPVLLLVSGGSSLKVLDFVNIVQCNHLTIGLVDERISKHAKDRNMSALEKTDFFRYTTLSKANYIRINQHVAPEESALQYETMLKTWVKSHDDGKIVVILGIGPDGHTAGEMPGRAALFTNPDRWVVGYNAKSRDPKHPLRVTVTNTFLRMVDTAAVFACGANKKEALERTLAPQGSISDTPARIIREMGRVALFTDQPLSHKL